MRNSHFLAAGLGAAVVLALSSTLAVNTSSARAAEIQHRLECPDAAPSEWHLPTKAPLVQAAVLSNRIGQAIDEATPPSLVPDRGYALGEVWHNLWTMGDEPGWSHFVDCHYKGVPKVLRLEADGLKQCEQTARPFDSKKGVSTTAVQTMWCD